MDTHRPPHFDGTNFPYYSARMVCYLEAIDLGVWRVTRDGMKPPNNPKKPTTSEEKEIHLNARAKKCLYESLSMDIFNQVLTLKTANEIWLKLHELHDGTSNVCEQKHCLVLNKYNSFAMRDDDLVRDMYSRLNLIINELNSIGINKLGDADIVRKIISLLPQRRYGSITTILHNMEDLSTMTPTIVIGKIVAFEMSRKMCRGEEPTSLKPYAFASDERKGKKKAPTPSSSSEEEEEEEEESDDNEDNQPCTSSSKDEETIRRIGKVMRMIRKINLMGVPLQVEDLLFNIDRKKQRKRGCFTCGEKGHFRDTCPTMAEPKKERSKGKALTSVRTWDDSSSEDEPPRMHGHRSSSRSSRSSHKCLMARGNKNIPSSSDESSSDDEGEGKPSVDELAEAVKFFQDVCTKQKTQLKTLKNKLISSQNDYKSLLEKFETFANLNSELSTKIELLEYSAPSTATDDGLIKKNEKLKAKLASSQESIENLLGKMEVLSIHNNELTTKLENIGSTPEVSLIEIPKINKKDASTSCFDLIDDSNPCNQVLVKNVIIETCSNEIAKENEQLKQEVARLGKALYNKKGKAKQIQPPQDNTTAGVNKPMEGETVICRICHKEGHKSFQCKAMTGDKQKPSSKISNTYIKKVDKKTATPYLIKKKKNGKVIAIKANKQANKGKGGAKGNNFNHEKHQEGLDPKREVSGPKV
jgi:hypothetical protein